MFKEIKNCRISNSNNLTTVLDLGNQNLSGIFPSSKSQIVEKSPLELVFCNDSGLLQLRHTYSLNEMYGENYAPGNMPVATSCLKCIIASLMTLPTCAYCLQNFGVTTPTTELTKQVEGLVHPNTSSSSQTPSTSTSVMHAPSQL